MSTIYCHITYERVRNCYDQGKKFMTGNGIITDILLGYEEKSTNHIASTVETSLQQRSKLT